MKTIILSTLAAILFAFSVPALDLGDAAPEIAVESWVSGEPADPTKTDGRTFYLVEVWSTTCPPCLRSIPLLGDLQKRYADQGLKIVSFTDDPVDDVEEFKRENPLEYSSFIDKDGASMINYMVADNRNTIPHAFLFDRSGTLVWIGNPLDNLESRIRKVIDGTLNAEKALAVRDARTDLEDAFRNQDVAEMLVAISSLETLEPDNPQYYNLHFRILDQIGFDDPGDFGRLFKSWYEGCADNATGMISLSRVALEGTEPAFRNPRLALSAARRAYALGGDSLVQAGLNLAEAYQNVGRIDLSLSLLDEMRAKADPDAAETISEARFFYEGLLEVGKTPDAEYKP
ncbi:MAG: TlpA family protein disulfide reductase [Planctomycetota bacterium]|jgi:thiol-disulfide isomerase/thioredoxin|nr:TlpA family protein disulfide reductase [Planctomycetota bacterium]